MIDLVKSKILKLIDDNSYNNSSIIFSFSFLRDNNFCVLHIYNPKNEELVIDEQNNFNKDFYKKVADMLFVQDRTNKKKGCFNHQRTDDDILYNKDTTLKERLNNFLRIEYTFILINLENKQFTPVSLFCLVKNYMYDVCTSYYHRNKGYMTKLLIHFFELVKKNKLKNGNHNTILLDVVRMNPDFESVKDYYDIKFDFSIEETLPEKIIMKKQI